MRYEIRIADAIGQAILINTLFYFIIYPADELKADLWVMRTQFIDAFPKRGNVLARHQIANVANRKICRVARLMIRCAEILFIKTVVYHSYFAFLITKLRSH